MYQLQIQSRLNIWSKFVFIKLRLPYKTTDLILSFSLSAFSNKLDEGVFKSRLSFFLSSSRLKWQEARMTLQTIFRLNMSERVWKFEVHFNFNFLSSLNLGQSQNIIAGPILTSSNPMKSSPTTAASS